MKNIVAFSGGKDSLATVLWAKNNLQDYDVVFCDTGWESPKTYSFITEIQEKLGKKFVVLKSDKFKDLIDLFVQKGRAASTKARFCTEEMKAKPMIDYVLQQKEDITILQGVRNDESQSRRLLSEKDEYFKFYLEPYGFTKPKEGKLGRPKYHTYRKKEVLKYLDKYSVDVLRPIIKWNAAQTFDYIFENNFKANPLYYEGFSRVGCFPCIMCKKSEIKLIAEGYKERIDEIRDFESKIGRTFFPANYIPSRFCSVKAITKKGKVVMCPSIDDVVKYVTDNENQTNMFDEPTQGCISVYNICENV